MVGTYVKIHKNEKKKKKKSLQICFTNSKLLLLLTICYFQDILTSNDSFCFIKSVMLNYTIFKYNQKFVHESTKFTWVFKVL